ncbi:zinc ribbon domain-containing protein [Faecalicatena acetigenes]|uniref:Zinc ribbon domain-containing protein n=1 Tax=Faecalicatena acetigenes TaxID=2981790 RepID=A0ABT2TCG9_9FIRM|nr:MULTISPECIES: zinc ribbon domain-containing protein [Lachnospiraceae]MCU6747567.1 zinc ribbon domain-containing protein [Faecalicatena acetigenes]SCH97173.1 Uncharacterised protein [uncultured Clostridium sp.]
MFCGNCGKKLEDGYVFCPSCGKKAFDIPENNQSAALYQTAVSNTENSQNMYFPALTGYLNTLNTRFEEQAEFVSSLHSYLYISKRMSAALVNMHQYFFITQNDNADYQIMENYTKACVQYALDNYKGLPRGLQKGVGIYAVMCQTKADPNAVAYTKKKPNKHYAAFELPIVVDLSKRQIEYMETTPAWGFAMWKGIKKAAQTMLIP